MSDIDRSLTGSTGKVTIYLDYGSTYFDYEFETNDLPEATEAMKTAASFDRYSETSVDLSQVNLLSRNWQLTPLKAGCYTEFGSYGRSEEGVRVDFEIKNLESKIRSFYDDALLRTPDGFTVEPDYSSTLRGLEPIPGLTEKGYLFFEDLDCLTGDYRIVLSNYSGVYHDEVFTLE